jgi:hypothetical protein
MMLPKDFHEIGPDYLQKYTGEAHVRAAFLVCGEYWIGGWYWKPSELRLIADWIERRKKGGTT